MLEKLISSRVRARVVSTFFLSPGGSYSASELAKKLDENYSAIWRELVRLEKLGLLASEQQGSSKIYWVNESSPIAPELRLIVLKTDGLGAAVKEALLKMGGVEEAYVYGSFAAGRPDIQSDIDLMIIGEVILDQLAPVISKLELELNRPINYSIFSRAEWQQREAEGDPFWMNVNAAPKIPLIGDQHAL